MGQERNADGMLSPYRVLDLLDEKGLLCGKLLGDLGADVIKVEKPGGDPARNIRPFYHDEPDPEQSLFWNAFNTSKRGITLDIESGEGQEIFRHLVKTADIVLESFPPGHMDGLGLGYSELEKVNRGIIVVSITPFGQTGPYKDNKASDIVAWAMGGMMNLSGDADRPPVRVSHHSQAYLHAGGCAAQGVMMALYHREFTGEGQHVDVSVQESVVPLTYMLTSMWDMMKVNQSRGKSTIYADLRITQMWPCKDGLVFWRYWSGLQAKRFNIPLIEWMDSEGMATDFLKSMDWDVFDLRETTQEVIDQLSEPTAKFFMSHTKAELYEEALKRRIIVYPVATAKDILESAQLAARGFWTGLEDPILHTRVTYPGAFAKTTEASPTVSRHAPRIGEHNEEIYHKELGYSRDRIMALSESGVSSSRSVNGGSNRMAQSPLQGIKVADFTWSLAGPLITKTLADYGAQVVKIESSEHPCLHRTTGPFKDGIQGLNRSGSFNQWNTGKLSITINLASTRGVELAKQLVTWADIVVENFAGGVIDKLGLGYEELKKVKHNIIMLSTCMMGQSGPYATHPGWGRFLAALTGFNYIVGWPDREPADLGPYTDYITPHFAVPTILAALLYRQRTGKGLYIDMSQYETAAHFMSPLILDYVTNRRIGGRMGNHCEYAAPHNAYRCRGEDRWCAIAVFDDAEWQSICRAASNKPWTREARFSTLQGRKENEDELDRLIEEWTINYSAEELMDELQSAGVAAGIVQTGEDLLEHDTHLKHRRYWRELDHPEIGRYHAPRPTFVLSKVPIELKRAPLLGEHNEYVLKRIVGMSDEDIAKLVIDGVIV